MTTTLRYDFRATTLGELLVAASARGVCLVRFANDRPALLTLLREEFPCATPRRDPEGLRAWVDAIVARLEGQRPAREVPLDVRGSQFQRRVWAALAGIPPGETRSYAELARQVGRPGAARAVGRACASNPVPVLVPCHRVIRSDGSLGGFLGGLARKRALLGRESIDRDPVAPNADERLNA
ncbi:MAG: hypothetical protein CL910_15290 [Deltaproteobacteria bacterium]|jgi:AraC family transcriptional regulator of adaptative response/methylated-DNA-[protein]-cysteine methyltransferase|nr:hypothetical protein [Deltaproteobacteria bacterium]